MAYGKQGDTETFLPLYTYKIIPPQKMAKKSSEGAGFIPLRNMEVQKAIQFRSTLHLPINIYKRMP